MQSTSTWTKRSNCNPYKLYGRIEREGRSYKGAPSFFKFGWGDWRVECDISPGKVLKWIAVTGRTDTRICFG